MYVLYIDQNRSTLKRLPITYVWNSPATRNIQGSKHWLQLSSFQRLPCIHISSFRLSYRNYRLPFASNGSSLFISLQSLSAERQRSALTMDPYNSIHEQRPFTFVCPWLYKGPLGRWKSHCRHEEAIGIYVE
jgi:hypothetical protein